MWTECSAETQEQKHRSIFISLSFSVDAEKIRNARRNFGPVMCETRPKMQTASYKMFRVNICKNSFNSEHLLTLICLSVCLSTRWNHFLSSGSKTCFLTSILTPTDFYGNTKGNHTHHTCSEYSSLVSEALFIATLWSGVLVWTLSCVFSLCGWRRFNRGGKLLSGKKKTCICGLRSKFGSHDIGSNKRQFVTL